MSSCFTIINVSTLVYPDEAYHIVFNHTIQREDLYYWWLHRIVSFIYPYTLRNSEVFNYRWYRWHINYACRYVLCISCIFFSMGNKEMDVAFITRRLMGEWCADALIILITFNSNVQLDGQRSQIRVYIYLFLMCKDNWGVIFLHWMSGQLFLHCPSLCLFIQQNNVWGVAWDKWRNRPYLHQLQENLLLINTRLINWFCFEHCLVRIEFLSFLLSVWYESLM